MPNPAFPFRSFWMGGYEGADHVNVDGLPLDMADCNAHLRRLDEDYANAAAHGLGCVRESIGWRLAERAPGQWDLARARRIAQCAESHGLQVIWTLMHYGAPTGLSLHDDAMIDRFAAYATAVARTLAPLSNDAPVYNLINEIGFLAWAVSETSEIHPYRRDLVGKTVESTESSGYEVKRRLVRAVLAGIDAVRRIDPRARFLHVEPIGHVAPPADRPELAEAAERIAAYQWQAWDLIGGLVEPELGGSAEALDLIGINHYHSGQWEVGTEERLWWHLGDSRRRPLSTMLGDAWRRYGRPLVIAETGHIGDGRADWLREVVDEVTRARAAGIPVGGICLYPLLDRHDWHDTTHWHRSGLWDIEQPSLHRVLATDYADALYAAQRVLPRTAPGAASVGAIDPLDAHALDGWTGRQPLRQAA